MLEQSKFLVSFDCQNEKFCEELIITYRTEELRPYLIFPRVKLNTKPHQQTKIHILNPTRPTDNPINPIRDLNPKNTKLLTPPNKNKYQNKY